MKTLTEQGVKQHKGDLCVFVDNPSTMRREATSVIDGEVKYWVSAVMLAQANAQTVEALGSIGEAPWGRLMGPVEFAAHLKRCRES